MRLVASLLCLFYAVQMIAAPADVEARRQQLNTLIAELWEWNLQQNPVFHVHLLMLARCLVFWTKAKSWL